MALTITAGLMQSTDTQHFALSYDDGWRVSWLGDRAVTRDQAITAMTIAEEVGRIPAGADPEAYSDQFWANVDGWAAELGMAGPEVVVLASELGPR